jgi:hypothetical protein
MSPWLFGFLNVTGTVGRLVLIAVVGDVFQSPIDAVLDFVGRYRVPLLVISIGLVLLSVAGEARRGRTEIDALKELEREDADEEGDRPRAADGDPAPPSPPEDPPLSGPGRA